MEKTNSIYMAKAYDEYYSNDLLARFDGTLRRFLPAWFGYGILVEARRPL